MVDNSNFLKKLKSVLDFANDATKHNDKDITSAVNRLVLGFGKGYGRYNTGQFMLSSQNANFNINHNLGSVPKFIAIWTEDEIPYEAGVQHCGGMIAFALPFKYPNMTSIKVKSNELDYCVMTAFSSSGSTSFSWQEIAYENAKNNFANNTDDRKFAAMCRSNSSGYVHGVTYKWIVVDW